MSAATLAGAAAQLAVVFITGWVVGEAALAAIARGRGREEGPELDGVGWPEKALLAFGGFVALAAGLMVAHIVTGGAMFGLPGVVPAVCALVVWHGARRRRLPAQIPWVPAACAVVALGLVYAWPAIAAGSGLRTGDIPWHMGWTEQLLAGDPVPTGPAPRFGANAYPWGFHAVLAAMVRAVPGTSTAVAVDALGFALIVAIPLSGACLARRIRSDAGWWGAAATGGIGGLGWVGAHDVTFVMSPSSAAFGADLVVASPNSVYELFPPALPREVGLVLLAGVAVLLLAWLRAGGRRTAIVPGVATGLVGLVSVPMFVSALLWALLSASIHRTRARAGAARVLVLAAAAVFSLWAAPVVTSYVRFGGFVDITPELGREWPLFSALASWGVLLPTAAAGLLWLVGRGGHERRILVAWVLVTAVLLALARVRAVLDWDLAGNATLLHQGRVWPVAHLLAAALAGAGLAWGYGYLRRISRAPAAVAMATLVAVGAISPVLASRSLADTMRGDEGGFMYGRADLAPGSFLRRAAGRLDSDDVVDVRGPHRMALLLWQFSGARLASYDDPRLDRNELRIRFRELAAAWDGTMARGGFEPGYAVVPASELAPDDAPVERGRFAGEPWALLSLP